MDVCGWVPIDDASAATANRGAPGTYRSNLMLVETSGQPATVRLTLQYSFAGGSLVTASATSTKDVTVNRGDYVLLTDLVRSIIGSQRDGYGDLHNMQLDVSVSGSGKVLSFLQTIDNGSGDVTLRSQ
jgi:hypothetical protein